MSGFNIQEELKKMPDTPGVYLMHDKHDDVIYVGKAINLKRRVSSYFRQSTKKSLKIQSMVTQIVRFEYILTDSELEALILECNLIKEYRPKYNTMLMDDKTYPYVMVTTRENYPRIVMARRMKKDGNKYFGPFTNSSAVKENIALIDKIWQVRRCSKIFPRDIGKGRPCLNYHIGQCKAVCTGKVSEEEYNKMIGEILDFLGGKTENVVKSLTSKMLKYSAEMEFEKAAEVRDTIESIKILNQKQIIENLHIDDRDVIGFARGIRECIMQIFFIRGGKITGREHFMLEECEGVEDKELMTQFVQQFYSGTPFIPKEVILQCEIDDFDLISQWLSEQKGQRVNVLVPQKGERKSLVLMAQNNAKIVLDKFGAEIRREHKRTKGALEEIQKALNIDFELNRIESYDISNTQGFESVASMVVFENGLPKRSDYRKFKIKTIIGPDDYGSMEEVITRRFTRYINETSGDENVKKAGFDKKPDMIFLDGGKGQISAVQKALTNLNLYVPVCGMVKDDRHRTRALMYNGEEIELPYTSEGFKLLTRMQDEVHRFAIEYHRKLREKKQVHSILDDISGIGSVRRKALMKHFGDINAIRRAEVEELQQVDGMNIKSAEAVYNFFRK